MKVALLGAALVAAAALATRVGAPRVVTNPGYCAQFYPNAKLSGLWAGQSLHRKLPGRRAQRSLCRDALPPVIAACPFASPHAPRR